MEEIADRRNYKLKCDWSCDTCGGKTNIYGVSLKGEKSFGTHQIIWDDIIHKKCYLGHVSIPTRECTRCSTEYSYGTPSCNVCDKIIERMIEFEDEYNELSITIKKMKRKKQETRTEDIRLTEIINGLSYIGYSPCAICDEVMTEHNKCVECCLDVLL